MNFETLTKSEREVAALVAEGFSNAEISAIRHTSDPATRSHVRSAVEKSGARSRVALAVGWWAAHNHRRVHLQPNPVPAHGCRRCAARAHVAELVATARALGLPLLKVQVDGVRIHGPGGSALCTTVAELRDVAAERARE